MPKIDAGRKVSFLIASSRSHDLPLAYPVREHGCGEAEARVGVGDVGAGVGLTEQDVRATRRFLYAPGHRPGSRYPRKSFLDLRPGLNPECAIGDFAWSRASSSIFLPSSGRFSARAAFLIES